MLTGTDISIATCRNEGYACVEHRRAERLDTSKAYHLTISEPSSWASGRIKVDCQTKQWRVNTTISYEDLWKAFERGGESIKSMCDHSNCPHKAPTENPDFHDFAALAQAIYLYNGCLWAT